LRAVYSRSRVSKEPSNSFASTMVICEDKVGPCNA
jgi:hypothetical protein